MIYVVLMESAINPFRMCLLGEGSTAQAAMEDAYGPKPWPRSSRQAVVRQVTEDELLDLRSGVNGGES